jgi:hypothetical protein
MIAGAFMAAGSVLVDVRFGMPTVDAEIAAVVGSVPITRAELERAVVAMAADRRADDGQTLGDLRKRVLARMVDEELLVAHAIDIGMARRDSTARKALVSAMIDSVVGDVAGEEPTDTQLEELFIREKARFIRTTGLSLSRIHIRNPANPVNPVNPAAAAERAEQARQALVAGEPFSKVHNRFGDEPDFPLPPGWIEPSTLATHTSPSLAEAALATPIGEASAVIAAPSAFDIVVVHDRKVTSPRGVSDVRSELEALWRRKRDESALDRYLLDLRSQAWIAVAADFARPKQH